MTEFPPPKAAPTLAEVARLAGVSIATASRVLNNSAPVSSTARQQVREAAIRLGYVRQRAAPVRPRSRIRSVAAVVCANQARLFADPFFARLINSASDVFAANDVPLMVIAATDDRMPTVERFLYSGQTDGVLLLADHGRYPLSAALTAFGKPVVMVGRRSRPPGAAHIPRPDPPPETRCHRAAANARMKPCGRRDGGGGWALWYRFSRCSCRVPRPGRPTPHRPLAQAR